MQHFIIALIRWGLIVPLNLLVFIIAALHHGRADLIGSLLFGMMPVVILLCLAEVRFKVRRDFDAVLAMYLAALCRLGLEAIVVVDLFIAGLIFAQLQSLLDHALGPYVFSAFLNGGLLAVSALIFVVVRKGAQHDPMVGNWR